MGAWNSITGKWPPENGVQAQSPARVWDALMSVNRSTAPFVIRDGRPEKADLVAEWRVIDAQWSGIFAKAGMRSVFQVRMKLDPEEAQVRAVDMSYEVSWEGGIARLSGSASVVRGRTIGWSAGQGHSFTERGPQGEIYNYRFSSEELKRPLRAAATGMGWTWREVVFGKL